MGLLLLLILLLLLFGGWSYRGDYGYAPSGIVGLLLIILLVMLIVGHGPLVWWW